MGPKFQAGYAIPSHASLDRADWVCDLNSNAKYGRILVVRALYVGIRLLLLVVCVPKTKDYTVPMFVCGMRPANIMAKLKLSGQA